MENQEKKFTWQDLKIFVNNLPEKELNKEVIWTGDERGGKIINASCLEEDYSDALGEGQESFSVFVENEMEDEFTVDYEKGTPILWVD